MAHCAIRTYGLVQTSISAWKGLPFVFPWIIENTEKPVAHSQFFLTLIFKTENSSKLKSKYLKSALTESLTVLLANHP